MLNADTDLARVKMQMTDAHESLKKAFEAIHRDYSDNWPLWSQEKRMEQLRMVRLLRNAMYHSSNTLNCLNGVIKATE